MCNLGRSLPHLLHKHTKSAVTCKTISSVKPLKTSPATATHWSNKNNTSKWVEEAKTQSHHNPTPSLASPNLEGTVNMEFLPKEERVWILHQAPHLLRPAPERYAPQISNFENPWDFYTKDPQIWKMALKGLSFQTHPPYSPVQIQQMARCPDIMWKRLIC